MVPKCNTILLYFMLVIICFLFSELSETLRLVAASVPGAVVSVLLMLIIFTLLIVVLILLKKKRTSKYVNA